MDNVTLEISSDGDLVIGDDGIMRTIEGVDTTAQNIRMALKAAKEDFPLLPEHGTDYNMIFGAGADHETMKEAYREAIFQEDGVEQINTLLVEADGRNARVDFEVTTIDGIEVKGST